MGNGDQCVGSLNCVLEGSRVMVMAPAVSVCVWWSLEGKPKNSGAGRTLSVDGDIGRWCWDKERELGTRDPQIAAAGRAPGCSPGARSQVSSPS